MFKIEREIKICKHLIINFKGTLSRFHLQENVKILRYYLIYLSAISQNHLTMYVTHPVHSQAKYTVFEERRPCLAETNPVSDFSASRQRGCALVKLGDTEARAVSV